MNTSRFLRSTFACALGVWLPLNLPASNQTSSPTSATAIKVAPAVSSAPWLLTPAERRHHEEIAAADRKRMMELLNVTEAKNLPPEESDPKRPSGTVRPPNNPHGWTDAAGNFVVRSGWGNWINYDLAKADVGPLPNPLVLKNRKPVTTATTWWQERRPEIVEDFAREIYGRIPANTPKITWEILETDLHALNGRATLKRIVGHIDNSRYPAATPSIQITLHLPNNATGPIPVLVAIGGFGPPPGFPVPKGPTALDLVLAHGWGYATFGPYAVQSDSGAGLTEGIIGLVNEGQPRKPDDWGAIAAWSWGLSRVIDYLETEPAVDAKCLGVQGHSRFGKTALVAAALDPRWAIAYASCSGEGGAKLHRHDYGESVDIVAWTGEYHWMAGNFLKYGGRWNDLPVDQHELIALVAPRPIFVTGGTQDLWPDPVGMFQACVAAGPVYRLLSKADLGTTEMPAPDRELIGGDIGFRLHTGGHTDLPDWPAFLQFSDKYFRSPVSKH